jgi:nucleoside-diphosphate-sugar epimerase
VPVKASEHGRPVSSYGRSKLAGEDEVRAVLRLSHTILRPCSIYGPRETAIRGLFVAASKGVVPVLAGGTARVQLVYATDVAAAVASALLRGGRNETFFVAHPEILDFRGIAEALATLPSKKAFLVPVPAAALRMAGLLIGAVSRFGSGPPVFNGEKAEEMLQPEWLCDVSDTEAALGRPFQTDFPTGAKKTWEWYVAEGWIRGDNIGPRKRN